MGITELDPLEHGLIFERFLNPERVSLPDIDVDFDPEGRLEARMHTRLADQALDAHRLIGDALGVRVRLVQLAELTRLGVPLGLTRSRSA